nr:immunoglobulin heavy chain junction region [Mus musculus]
CATPDGFDYW